MSRIATGVGTIVLVALGVLIGGVAGGLAAIAGLGIARWRGYRAVAGAALLALVVAIALTVVEAPATGEAADYLFDFALDRPGAAEAGRVAGVLAVVAVALAAVRERPPDPAPVATSDEQPDA